LTSSGIRSYIETQGLEKYVNMGINKVLREKPADGLSALAAFLVENASKVPVFN